MSEATSTLQPSNESYVTPAVDIYENDQELIFLADMAGIKRENLSIDIDKGLLTFDGWYDEGGSSTGENARIHYRRRFQVGSKFDSAQASATLEQGVLKVELPRLQQAMPQRIEIQVA